MPTLNANREDQRVETLSKLTNALEFISLGIRSTVNGADLDDPDVANPLLWAKGVIDELVTIPEKGA